MDPAALIRDVQSRFTPDPLGIVTVVRPDSEDKDEMELKGNERALELGGFKRLKCKGDGNCALRALSKGLFAHQHCYPELRQAIIALMRTDYDLYCNRYDYTELQFNAYLENLAKDSEHVGVDVIQAAADLLHARIFQTISEKSKLKREYVPHHGDVSYEISLISTLKHLDALGRDHVYEPL